MLGSRKYTEDVTKIFKPQTRELDRTPRQSVAKKDTNESSCSSENDKNNRQEINSNSKISVNHFEVKTRNVPEDGIKWFFGPQSNGS